MRYFPREAKISNLPNPISDKDVGRLQISMNYVIQNKILTPLRNLMNNTSPLYIFLISNVFFKVASFAILGNQIAVTLCIIYINEFDDVRVVQLLNNCDLAFKQIDICMIHIFEFDYFDCVPCRFVIIADALINTTLVSASDQVLEVKRVRSDSLFAFTLAD